MTDQPKHNWIDDLIREDREMKKDEEMMPDQPKPPEALDPEADLANLEVHSAAVIVARRYARAYESERERAEKAEATILRICAAYQGDDPEPPTPDEMVADAPDFLHAMKQLAGVMDMDDRRRKAEARLKQFEEAATKALADEPKISLSPDVNEWSHSIQSHMAWGREAAIKLKLAEADLQAAKRQAAYETLVAAEALDKAQTLEAELARMQMTLGSAREQAIDAVAKAQALEAENQRLRERLSGIRADIAEHLLSKARRYMQDDGSCGDLSMVWGWREISEHLREAANEALKGKG